MFKFTALKLNGVFVINNFYKGDERGFFVKCFEQDIYREAGINFHVNEIFVSKSQKNVIRGIHFQLNNPQAKLVCVVSGKAYDVIVDLRKDSKTYKQWVMIELSENNHKAVYVPRGFGHGFLALQDNTLMLYQCDGKYDLESDTGIRFDDKELNINWCCDTNPIVSERDLNLMSFREYEIILNEKRKDK